MRISRFLFAALFAANALAPTIVRSTEGEPAEYIVNSQVISDEVVEGGASDCLDGNFLDGGSGSSGGLDSSGGLADSGRLGGGLASGRLANGRLANGRLANGRIAGRLAGATSYIGDLVRGNRPGDGVCVPRTYGYPDLFYNFYTQGNCNQTNAQMYVAPVPVPPNVGHTFYTYQPFMPHEMLYWHKDRYHNYYDGGRGMNHTKVNYYAPPVRQTASTIYWNYLRIPR